VRGWLRNACGLKSQRPQRDKEHKDFYIFISPSTTSYDHTTRIYFCAKPIINLCGLRAFVFFVIKQVKSRITFQFG